MASGPLNRKHRPNSLKFRLFLVQENPVPNGPAFCGQTEWSSEQTRPMYISTGLLFQAMIPKSHSSTLEGSAEKRLDLRRE